MSVSKPSKPSKSKSRNRIPKRPLGEPAPPNPRDQQSPLSSSLESPRIKTKRKRRNRPTDSRKGHTYQDASLKRRNNEDTRQSHNNSPVHAAHVAPQPNVVRTTHGTQLQSSSSVGSSLRESSPSTESPGFTPELMAHMMNALLILHQVRESSNEEKDNIIRSQIVRITDLERQLSEN
jgi:hypothetical protein